MEAKFRGQRPRCQDTLNLAGGYLRVVFDDKQIEDVIDVWKPGAVKDCHRDLAVQAFRLQDRPHLRNLYKLSVRPKGLTP